MTTENTTICVFNQPNLGQQFTSFHVDTFDEKKALYNAINAPDYRISEFINKRIDMRDVVINAVVLTAGRDDNVPNAWTPRGEDQDAFRVIIIDKENKTYTATSSGIYNSVKNIFNIFGTLHFDEPMPVEITQVKTKNGNTLTLTLVD